MVTRKEKLHFEFPRNDLKTTSLGQLSLHLVLSV